MGSKGSISLSFRIIVIDCLHNSNSWAIEKFSSINILALVNFTYERCPKLETRQIKNVIDGNFLQLGKCTHLEDECFGQQLHSTTLVWPIGMGLDRRCCENEIMMRIRHHVSLYSEEDASTEFPT